MPVEINDSDILMAEKILFGKTSIFSICEGYTDEVITSKNQRIEFIKDLRTLDLRAVPGSGKTTALLAKLIILESKLPFDDGSGILVLSHTNAAVDEIKRKIEHHCPKLFHYPNFVGTIQSFVDQFLAIPFYRNSFLQGSLEIGNERYFSQYSDSFQINLNIFCKNNCINKEFKTLLIRYYNADKPRTHELYFGSTSKELIKGNGSIPEFKIPKESKERLKLMGNFSVEEKERFGNYYKNLVLDSKRDLLKSKGLIPYRDAYSFANILLCKYLPITGYLQNRFKMVFVDEMQDMDKHQVDLLEILFYDEGKRKSLYQRIGDKNQAIHNPKIAGRIEFRH
jgi:superfamily I DNA/RNA helicase